MNKVKWHKLLGLVLSTTLVLTSLPQGMMTAKAEEVTEADIAEEVVAEEIPVEDAAPEVIVAENEPVAAEEDFAE